MPGVVDKVNILQKEWKGQIGIYEFFVGKNSNNNCGTLKSWERYDAQT